MATTDYGIDVGCGPDGISPLFDIVDGRQCLVEAIMHRYETPRGGLADDPNYGLGVKEWVGKRTNAAQLMAWGQALGAEARKDPRVRSARGSIALDGERLVFSVQIEPIDGEAFALTAAISDVSVELLSVT
jgi:hypothetical protein